MEAIDGGDGFNLQRGSTVLYTTAKKGRKSHRPEVFAPRTGGPSLESRSYGFIIDPAGKLWFSRADTHYHASFFKGPRVAAAGQVRLNLRGEVVLVSCRSVDYSVLVPGPDHVMVRYVIEHFATGSNPKASPHSLYRFWSPLGELIDVNSDGRPMDDTRSFFAWIHRDDPTEPGPTSFGAERLSALEWYQPPPPSAGLLRPTREPGDEFEPSGPRPPYGRDGLRRLGGIARFVIDARGELLVGDAGPIDLANGGAIAVAGRLSFETPGDVVAVELDAEFADAGRYARLVLEGHPLLDFAERCQWTFAREVESEFSEIGAGRHDGREAEGRSASAAG